MLLLISLQRVLRFTFNRPYVASKRLFERVSSTAIADCAASSSLEAGDNLGPIRETERRAKFVFAMGSHAVIISRGDGG